MSSGDWPRQLFRLVVLTVSLLWLLLASTTASASSYGRVPLHFEANRGQTDPRAEFLARGPGHTLFLTATEAILVVRKPEPRRAGNAVPSSSASVLRMRFVGANPHPSIAGRDELPGQANYFIGRDPSKWRTRVPTYAKVHYQDLYPGIDLLYYGNERELEYDFVVHPGADPDRIALAFEGARTTRVDDTGDLILETAAGVVRHRRPVIYQEIDGVRREIAGRYVLADEHRVGFRIAAYDAGRPLVIDPVILYSTHLGGSAEDLGRGIAVDAQGNAYVTGFTASVDFPTTEGAVQTYPDALGDVFVTKLDPTGTRLVYSTYLGCTGFDFGIGIAVDHDGSAYVTGITNSPEFPTTPGAFQTTPAGATDAFVTKLDPTGTALVYSTYLGGASDDGGFGIAVTVDDGGNAYVTGQTSSTDFPTTTEAFQTSLRGVSDAFVTKLDPTGTGLAYSTYLGGTDVDQGFSVAVDHEGHAYVTGQTTSTDFPTTAGVLQSTFGGVVDAFVTTLNPTGTGLVYSTYLGGSGTDGGFGVAVDHEGNATVTGSTTSADFPTTQGAFQVSSGGGFDAFVAKLHPDGSGLLYSTYLGGSGSDFAIAIGIVGGEAYVTGETDSTNFPTSEAFQSVIGGATDAFVTKLDPTGTALVYSSYLGGTASDAGFGIAVDGEGNAYINGETDSTNFPTTEGAFQTTGGGGFDAFVTKVSNQ